MCDKSAVNNSVGADILRKSRYVLCVNLPCRIVQVKCIVFVKKIHVCFPEGVDRSDVFPVSLIFVSAELLLVIEKRRDNVFSEIVAGIRVLHIGKKRFAKQFPVEDIDTHGSKIALRVFRLLFKFYDASCFIGVHDTESARFFHRNFNDCDCRVGFTLFVECEHPCIVHFVNMVAGENKKIFRRIRVDKVYVL